MNVREHFISLNAEFSRVIDLSLASDSEKRISNAFEFVEDLLKWQKLLEKRVDTTIFLSAIQEYELSFQAALCGQYRYAFISQRYFLEQICRFIYLSTNELYLRHWKLGLRDIAWGTLTEKDSGIFSAAFIRAFFPAIEAHGSRMQSAADKLYRESSEFVHGNYQKIEILPNQIKFSEHLIAKWVDSIESNKVIVLFVLFMRFSYDFDPAEIRGLYESSSDDLCDIEGFNSLLLI